MVSTSAGHQNSFVDSSGYRSHPDDRSPAETPQDPIYECRGDTELLPRAFEFLPELRERSLGGLLVIVIAEGHTV